MAHQNKKNQAHHFSAALMPIILGVIFAFNHQIWLLAMIPIASYSLAWIGHLMHEKNTPLTWTYPVFSLLADYKMFYLMCIGKMDQEILKLKTVPAAEATPSV